MLECQRSRGSSRLANKQQRLRPFDSLNRFFGLGLDFGAEYLTKRPCVLLSSHHFSESACIDDRHTYHYARTAVRADHHRTGQTAA